MWALALSKNMTVRDVSGYIPPYPTMSEIGKRAAITYYHAFYPQTVDTQRDRFSEEIRISMLNQLPDKNSDNEL